VAISRFDIDAAVDRLMYVDGRGHLLGLPTQAASSNLTTGVPVNSIVGWAPGALFYNFKSNPGTLYVNTGTYLLSTWTQLPTSGSTIASLTVTALTATALTTPAYTNTGTETVAVGANTIALGTNSATAAALPAGTASVYPTTAADGTVGVIINAADKVTGRRIFIGNGVSNQILKVYGPTGAVINGAAADAAFSSVSGKGVWAVCLSGAGNTWLMA